MCVCVLLLRQRAIICRRRQTDCSLSLHVLIINYIVVVGAAAGGARRVYTHGDLKRKITYNENVYNIHTRRFLRSVHDVYRVGG